MNEWQPIETAPHPGTYLCLGHNRTMFICHFNRGNWWRQSYSKRIVGLTHWMPLPPPPEIK